MGFFQQNQKEERAREKLVLLFYSIYSINLCLGAVRKGWDLWIPVVLIAAPVIGWIVYVSRYRTFRIRAGITAFLVQLTVILYAAHMTDVVVVIPTFMALLVLISLYGITELAGFSVVSILFIAFYHGVIADTFQTLPSAELQKLLFQAGNLLCLEITIYLWLKKRNENEDRIYQMIDALMDAEQSKDDFLSNVSHEIRTPVNTICGMSDIALRETDLEKMRDEVFAIREAGSNLMSLVSDILDFSQLQRGNMDIEEEAYNLTSTINDIINIAMARKGDKPIELIVDCDPGIPRELLGDEKKIRRVIMNLVDNAIKFTNDGGIIITIGFRKENYGINLWVAVKDTGIGISEENMEKLFESFSQVDTRRNRQEGGVGLGLAISKALVQKMGGTITVRSRLGKGSIFRFVVPQKVLDERPMGQVENRDRLNIAAYFDMEQFDMMAIRDEYTNLIVHMVGALQVKCHVCRNLAELKRREGYDAFSHIFISLEEYQEDEAYFDELARHAEVIMVIDRPREKYVSNPDIVRLYKPFHILPVISILNGSRDATGGRQLVRQGKFVAPDVHVLVVDDNRMNIRVIEGMLKEYQIKVTYALSGSEAIKLIEDMCYDFVFMDHMMPEMDGIETLHEIRKLSDFPNEDTPVIVLTANALSGAREAYLQEGFVDFLTKPIDGDLLEQTIAKYLPPELIQRKEAAAPKEKTGDAGAAKQDLQAYGISTARGLSLAKGDEELYLDLAGMFIKDKEKQEIMGQYISVQNMADYAILVHGLKGNARTLGADALAALAYEHEMRSKAGDCDYVAAHWDELLKVWDNTLEGFQIYCESCMGEGGKYEAVSSEGKELLQLSCDDLEKVVVLLDDFETQEAIGQLKEWIGQVLEPEMYERIKNALIALEDEFDEEKAIQLLRE